MVQLMMNRIRNARRARDNAQNPEFKEYWQGVIDKLVAKIS